MRSLRLVCLALIVLSAALAQGQVGGRGRGGQRQQPCWQQAGITQGALAERRQILQKMWNDISLVCNNTSLSAQQKKDQAGEIREIARQKLSNVVTPQQEMMMRQCQQERQVAGGPARNRRGGWGDAGLGRVYDNPCSTPEPKPAPPREAKPNGR
jgi:hypothetical protein